MPGRNTSRVYLASLLQSPKTKVLKDLPMKKITCPIDDGDFTIEEYRKVVDSLEEGKNAQRRIAQHSESLNLRQLA